MTNSKCCAEPVQVAWVDGWTSTPAGPKLRLFLREGPRRVTHHVAPAWMAGRRAYEPSLRVHSRWSTANVQFTVPDLSILAPLMSPGELLGQFLPEASETQHSIFVIEGERGRIYLPAMLLIQVLWLWSERSARMLWIPNSLDAEMGPAASGLAAKECVVTADYLGTQLSDVSLRRLAWLAQCSDARSSWSSVLTNAHIGKLSLSLPRAELNGWVWGIQVAGGVLACQLMAPHLTFDLVAKAATVRVGRTVHLVPDKPLPQRGLISF